MREVTRIYSRLPSDAGIVFEGFENITIKSRLNVKKKLEEFIEIVKSEKKPTMRVIIGEWGEGKTDAFRRYIKPVAERQGYHAFFLSASTISNSFELADIKRLINATPSSSLQFLVVLFASIKSESEITFLPEPSEFTDSTEFVEESLLRLFKDKNKLIIFIDEFEELLLNPSILKKIISGIKETINGQYRPVYEKGKFEGCLHFIIAATPDAFYKLQVSEDTSLIFGGLGRRIGIIELPEIRKEEGIPFLWELLGYCYEGNLPIPLPIRSIGILNGIYKISCGNPGNMVSKLHRLMNSAKINDSTLRIIDYNLFIDFFRNEQIFVYGGATPCIELENYNRILNIIKDQKRIETGRKCEETLKLLIGEYKPFSVSEIEKRIKIKDVPNIVNIINNNLRRIGIHKAILSIAKLEKSKTLDDVKNKLSEFIIKEKDTEIIKIGGYIESVKDFIDRITFYDIIDGKLRLEVYLPIDDESVASFFGGIDDDRLVEIRNKLRKLCDSSERYYLIGDELLSQIFPTPIPKELEFIRDRELKMKLWREVTRKLVQQYEIFFPDALLTIFETSKIFDIKKIKDQKGVSFVKLIMNGKQINTLFFAVNGDLKGEDIDKIHKYIKSLKPPIHLVLAFYTGDITEQAEEKIENKELGKNGENIIMPIKLHTTLLKRILIMHRVYCEYPDKINNELFFTETKKVIQQDLEIDNKLNEWFIEQKSLGLIVTNPILEFARSSKELADSLKFYINFLGENLSPEDVFKKNRKELQKYIKYGSRIGFIPDIESIKTLENISIDLENNGFLKRKGKKYQVIEHSVEKRILKIVNAHKGKIDIKSLEEYFIIDSSNKRILRDLFLNILEHKGRISRKGDYIQINNEEELRQELELLYQNLRVNINRNIRRYGYCFIKKQRESKIVSLDDFWNFVSTQYSEVNEKLKGIVNIRLQKLFLLCKLMEYFSEEWLEAIKIAKKKADERISETEEKLNIFKFEIENLCNDIEKLMKIVIDINGIEEYRKATELFEEIKNVEESEYEKLQTLFEKYYKENKGETFFEFKRNTTEYPYFNMRFFVIDILAGKFDNIREYLSRKLDSIKEELEKISNDLENISSRIKSKEVSNKFILSYEVLKYLKICSKNVMPSLQQEKIDKTSITEIEKLINHNLKPIRENISAIEQLIKYLGNLHNQEKKIHEISKKVTNSIKDAKEIIDLKEYKQKFEETRKKFGNLLNDFNAKSAEISSSMDKDPSEFLDYLEKELNLIDYLNGLFLEINQIEKEIKEIQNKYQQKTLNYLEELTNIIRVVSEKKKINTASLLERINLFKTKLKETKVRKFSEIEKGINEIRKNFYEIIGKALSKEELLVLENVTKLLKESKIVWIDQLYDIIKKEASIDMDTLNQIIWKLSKEGYLKLGLSLV